MQILDGFYSVNDRFATVFDFLLYCSIYVTGNLCNQALRVMTEHFSHFAKCLNSLAISRNA